MNEDRAAKRADLAARGLDYLIGELCREYRFLTPAFRYLTPVPDEMAKGFSTDGTYLFYQPEAIISAYTEGQRAYRWLKYQYLHIVIHCLFGHVRGKQREEDEVYDRCADFQTDLIMEELTGKKRKVKGGGSAFKNSYENLHGLLKNRKLNAFVRFCRKDRDAKLALDQLGGKLSSDDHYWWHRENPAIRLSGRLPAGERGSDGAAGDRESDDPTAGKEGLAAGTGEEPDHDSPPERDGWDQLREMVFSDNNSAGGKWFSHAAGTAGICVRAESENASDYRELLRRFAGMAELVQREESEYDWMWYQVGMELYGDMPILEPAEYVERLDNKELVIAIDTSGSCAGYASRFLRETCSLLRDMGAFGGEVRVRILECDAEIQSEIVIRQGDDIPDFEECTMHGWGGTSFVPVFEYIEEKRKSGEIDMVGTLLYYSDGIGDFPDQKPDYPTVFIFPDDGCQPYVKDIIPEWVETMKLTEQDMESLERYEEDTAWNR
ncbi:MAG: VWA-like domain-containing protein [Lachnospiraceae bacterium]|nr:VWA-like domain-containing protein [Lachnospiraceae bacterium]